MGSTRRGVGPDLGLGGGVLRARSARPSEASGESGAPAGFARRGRGAEPLADLIRSQRLHEQARVEATEIELRDPVGARVRLHFCPALELLPAREPRRTLQRWRLLDDEELALDPVHATGVLTEELRLHGLRGAEIGRA